MDSNMLKSIEEVPLPYRSVFSKYPCFNKVQSAVFEDAFLSDKSFVVAAPTGSGKTAIFELAILRLLNVYKNLNIKDSVKIVYVSPMRALCQERLLDWHQKFSELNLNCISVTGDSDYVDFRMLMNHNLIVTTPEKWDSLTRKWRDNKRLVQLVKLFMIDEVHLLNDESRGPTLEAIVSRMKTIAASVPETCRNFGEVDEETGVGSCLGHRIRFVAASATVLNCEDVAAWIGQNSEAKFFKFPESMRPVPLNKIVLAYPYNPKLSSCFRFDISLNYKLANLLTQYSQGKPTIIFCSTRKSVEMAADHLVKTITVSMSDEQKEKLSEAVKKLTDRKVADAVLHGVGYHHAGLVPENRHIVERMFRENCLPILITTSTLAMGVNLPAHLVIIKGTKCYENGGYRDYSETALLQMVGRAGRPQFDTSGTALILTTLQDKAKFEGLIGGIQPLESNLHKHLTEHLNAEIALYTITDLEVAMQWLSSTFLYIRAKKNPRHYGLPLGLTNEQTDKKLLEICQIHINKLVNSKMASMDQNVSITPTVVGSVMAKYCVSFESMKMFTEVSGRENLQQILGLISRCKEFSELPLRTNEKKDLNLLNKNKNNRTIRFPLAGRIRSTEMKINCIIQAVLGCMEIHDQSILSDSFMIMRNGERIIKCLIEYLETRENDFSALLNSITLLKCFRAKLWENSPFVTKQLSGIGHVMSTQLANAGKNTFEKIRLSNPREIEMILKKKLANGDKLIQEVKHLPIYKMEVIEEQNRIEIVMKLENVNDLKSSCTLDTEGSMVLIAGDDLNQIFIYKRFTHSLFLDKIEIREKFEYEDSMDREKIEVYFLSEEWVGLDKFWCKDFVVGKSENTVKKKADKFMELYAKIKNDAAEKIKKKKETPTKSSMQRTISGYFRDSKPLKQRVKDKKSKKQEERKIEETASKTNDIIEPSKNGNTNPQDTNNFKIESLDFVELEDFGINLPSQKNQPQTPTPTLTKENQTKIKEQNSPKENKPSNIEEPKEIPKSIENSPKLNFGIDKLFSKPDLEISQNLKKPETKEITNLDLKYSKAFDVESAEVEDPRKTNTISQFRFGSNKKVLRHDEGSARIKDEASISKKIEIEANTNPKTITWRSPLIESPLVKHSPNIINRNRLENNAYKTLIIGTPAASTNSKSDDSASISKKDCTLPLSDGDYSFTPNRINETRDFSKIYASMFSDEVKTDYRKKRKNVDRLNVDKDFLNMFKKNKPEVGVEVEDKILKTDTAENELNEKENLEISFSVNDCKRNVFRRPKVVNASKSRIKHGSGFGPRFFDYLKGDEGSSQEKQQRLDISNQFNETINIPEYGNKPNVALDFPKPKNLQENSDLLKYEQSSLYNRGGFYNTSVLNKPETVISGSYIQEHKYQPNSVFNNSQIEDLNPISNSHRNLFPVNNYNKAFIPNLGYQSQYDIKPKLYHQRKIPEEPLMGRNYLTNPYIPPTLNRSCSDLQYDGFQNMNLSMANNASQPMFAETESGEMDPPIGFQIDSNPYVNNVGYSQQCNGYVGNYNGGYCPPFDYSYNSVRGDPLDIETNENHSHLPGFNGNGQDKNFLMRRFLYSLDDPSNFNN